ncbi:MAG: D-tyrosyl-tRNA(Tyr) deacylase [Verrucomicrobiae bacterium]|jgi:D-tyrosyl-tRNA(Tyr) deacylase|nr:D-tyrosyl-tRNA(Tyr) deacylase [Verrucomicrobiae bacterium]
MRVILQRVRDARVRVEGQIVGEIGIGLLILVGIEDADTVEDVSWLAGKIVRQRIFADSEGLMNRSVIDIGGELLVVSQFTLYASTRKGNRPSFTRSARPEHAVPLYEEFVNVLQRETGKRPETGRFGAMMEVELLNDGPVTIVMDSRARE